MEQRAPEIFGSHCVDRTCGCAATGCLRFDRQQRWLELGMAAPVGIQELTSDEFRRFTRITALPSSDKGVVKMFVI